jgi:GT2 family glycosyltransferase
VGFAAGNNLGFAKAKGDYILMLNPDTEIDPWCVAKLVEVMDTYAQVAICGAKIRLLDKRNVLQHAGGKYSLIGISIDRGMCEVDKGQYDKIEEVTFVCGAAMMFRRSLISEVGLFDSSFFLYHEEVDFCIRVWFHGGKVVYVPDALVYHKSGYLTEIGKRTSNPLVVFHKHKNTLMILLKNFSIETVIIWLPVSILYKMYWVLSFLSKNDGSAAVAVLKSILWFFQNMDRILENRQQLSKIKTATEGELKWLFRSTGDVWNTFRRLSKL